tara:strand:+ start:475 stop:762 length:288 start_codon:yes stop_codon:yes gene_type:complete
MENSNRLIAEFMGLIESSIPNKYWTEQVKEGFGKGELVELKYHTSWDWLMPVLKKINLQLNPDNYNDWRMINKPTEYDIEDVYEQAVYFITDQNN